MHLLTSLTLNHVSLPPYCSNSITSRRVCFYFYYLFYSSLHSKFTFALCALVKSCLFSAFDIVFFLWILMNSRRECNVFSWPHFFLLLLSLPAPLLLDSPRFLLILPTCSAFLSHSTHFPWNMLPTPVLSTPTYMLMTQKSEYTDSFEFLIYIFKYPKDTLT